MLQCTRDVMNAASMQIPYQTYVSKHTKRDVVAKGIACAPWAWQPLLQGGRHGRADLAATVERSGQRSTPRCAALQLKELPIRRRFSRKGCEPLGVVVPESRPYLVERWLCLRADVVSESQQS